MLWWFEEGTYALYTLHYEHLCYAFTFQYPAVGQLCEEIVEAAPETGLSSDEIHVLVNQC